MLKFKKVFESLFEGANLRPSRTWDILFQSPT